MKKIIFKFTSVAVVLCMLMLCNVSFYATEQVDYTYILAEDVNVNAKVDDIIEIPVSVSENQGMMGFKLLVSYDSDILAPVSVDRGEALGAGLLNDSIGTSDMSVLQIVWTGSDNCYENGLLFTMKFKVLNADFTSTEVKFDYSQPDTFNVKYDDVKLSFDNSTINNFKTGDVNFDGIVNVVDATTIQKYSVGLTSFDSLQKQLADVNNDGAVNVSDATLIQKQVVGLA